MHSPCFVHSHLDKGASLADWLRTRKTSTSTITSNGHDGTNDREPREEMQPLTNASGSLNAIQHAEPSQSNFGLMSAEEDLDDGYGGSLTRQLAETAVGVREMSKQLGKRTH